MPGCQREGMGARRSAARDRARPPGRARPDHRRRDRDVARRGRSPTSMPHCSHWKPKAPRCAATSSRTSRDTALQWCDRRLLARIHRYTVKRLRAEIEPVQARDFLRFLFDWQRVTPTTRMQGPDAVPPCSAQLEGFDAPASAWETEVLPARIAEYDPAWLDEQCLAGRIVWTRLATRAGDAERGAAPVRSTPIALLPRRNVRLWSSFADAPGDAAAHAEGAAKSPSSSRRTARRSSTRSSKARGLLPTQVEEALAELVALGLVNSDSFGGLRALLVPADRRRPTARDARRKRRIAIFGMQDAGRWALVQRKPQSSRTAAGRRHRARVPHAAAALGRGVLEAARARSGLAAAVAADADVLAAPGSARRDPRRPLRRGILRRAVRVAGSGRAAARCATQAERRRVPVAVRGRSAEPGRHPDAGRAAAFADRQSRALRTACRSRCTRAAK